MRDFTGMTIGSTTVLKYLGKRGRYHRWLCKCNQCGSEIERMHANVLTSKICDTCRLKQLPAHTRTHGQSKSPTYMSWRAMKRRCDNPKDSMYSYYGGRGVTYEPIWGKYENFVVDMGERPSRGHTLDRLDTSKPYSKENCRWATRAEQTWNREATVMIEVDGYCKPATVWAKEFGIPTTTVLRRYKKGVRGHELFTKGRKYYGKQTNS